MKEKKITFQMTLTCEQLTTLEGLIDGTIGACECPTISPELKVVDKKLCNVIKRVKQKAETTDG